MAIPAARRAVRCRSPLVEPLESRIAPALAPNIPVGSLTGSNGFSASGSGQVGNDVSIVGDVNGDGYDDVLVSNFATPSVAYVVFGKASGFSANVDLGMLGTGGFALVKPSAKDASNFALTLGGVGDLNGDGYADFAIGSAAEDIGAIKTAGAVYVVFGKAGFAGSVNLDTLTGADGFKLTGPAANAFLGSSIASAGDLNSDGYGDLVVTASGANGSAGAAYVVFGKATAFAPTIAVSSLSGVAGFQIAGEKVSDFLGQAASAGDVNGDGFGDLILGAPGNDNKGAAAGSAYVVFGHAGVFPASLKLATLNGAGGFKIRGEKAGDNAGFSVSSAGDFNGDGFGDVLVGAIGANAGATNSGAAYLVFGKASFASELLLSAVNGSNGAKFVDASMTALVGYSVAAAGDVNGDGFDDALISSQHVGGAYVVYGKAGGFSALTDLTALQSGEGFAVSGTRAYRLAGAGDINGDGLDDVLIGARDLSRVHVVFGFDSGAITHPGDSGANTLTGDGNANVIDGAQGNDTLLGKGGADVLRGGQGDDVLAVPDLNFFRLTGGTGIDTLRLDGAGLSLDLTTFPHIKLQGFEQIDLTGTGNNTLMLTVQDVVNLSPTSNTLTVLGNTGDSVDFGPGWILFGKETIGATVFEVYTSGAATLKVAAAVATSLPEGYHPHALDGGLGVTIKGPGFTQFARSLTSAGDVNGDGFDDLIAGDYQASFPGGAGAAYVIFGKAGGLPANLDVTTLDGTNGFRLTGLPGTVTSFGAAVSAAGDVNGDGFADVIVGAFNESPNADASGAAYVIFGQASGFSASVSVASLNTAGSLKGFKMSGQAVHDNAGATVGRAGDVNGDGFDDVIVGAAGVDAGGVNSGAAYVVFGKAGGFAPNIQLTALTGADGFRISGVEKNAYLGSSVNSAGDLNGDGFADIVVGAIASKSAGAYSGAAYVVFGKAAFSADVKAGTGGFRIRGAVAGDRLGAGAGSAGDFNGDGLGDLIVGAFSSNVAGADSGAAYVIFGKTTSFGADVSLASLNGLTGFRLLGANPGDLAGYAASTAGDVNGDGFDDIIVGASGGFGSGADHGNSFVVYGKASFPANFNLGSVDGANGFKLVRAAAGDGAGSAVSKAGDVNGDGYDDLLVGAPFASAGGAAYLLYGFDSGAVTQHGTPGNDTLTGTGDRDVIVAGVGSDTLLNVGFGDALRGGAGNDNFSITTGPLQRLAGGHGHDTITLNGNLLLDLTARPFYRITGFEEVDLRPGLNYLSLDARGVVDASPDTNTLIVQADAADVINIGTGWTVAGSEIIGPDTFTVFKQGAATLKISTAAANVFAPIVTLVNATTATYTDVDGDLVTLKTSKGTLGISDFFLVPSGIAGGAQLTAVNLGDDGTEFQGADLTITAHRTSLGGDGHVNVGRIDATGVDLGKVSIAGDLGRLDAGDGTLTTPGIKALSIGSIGLFGSTTQGAGGLLHISVQGEIGALTVKTDFVNATVLANVPATAVGLGAVTIGGSIVGDGASIVNFFTPGSTGPIKIGGDMRGGPSGATGILSFDIGGNIASLTVGGSLAAGVNTGIGAVNAGGTFGSITIGGDLDHTKLSAVKSFTSLTVAGSVLSSRVLAGFDLFEVPTNADATVGAVTVGGDWVASSLTDAAQNTGAGALLISSGTPAVVGGDPAKIAKIASIAIKGEVLGTPGGTDSYEFVAEQIGSFKVGGTAVTLKTGAANDLDGGLVGSTFDVRVHEVSKTATPFTPVFAGPQVNLGALDGTNGFRTTGLGVGAQLGKYVSAAGDVNGDGFDDIIIGAAGTTVAGQTNIGEAYVIFGGAAGFPANFDPSKLNGTNGFRIQSNFGNKNSYFALAVAGGGDVNKDGYADVIVGGIDFEGLAGSRVEADVIFGGPNGTFGSIFNTAMLTGPNGFKITRALDSTVTGGGVRLAVANAGDVNHDGYDDILVSDVNADFGGDHSGSTYLVFSPGAAKPATVDLASLNGSNGVRFDGRNASTFSGASASTAGDLNGDGFADIIVSTREASGSQRGAAYVIFGRSTFASGVLTPSQLTGTGQGFRISPEFAYSSFATTVSGGGDVNGDGFDDVVIGDYGASSNGDLSGSSYVVFGHGGSFAADFNVSTLNGTNGFKIIGESANDYAGHAALAGDVNGDGLADVIVGADGADRQYEFKGAAYVVYGRGAGAATVPLAALTGANGFKLTGIAAGDETGVAVSGAGDFNGDGHADLLIGADTAPTNTNVGYAFVVLDPGLTNGVKLSTDGKTGTFTDVDGDLVTVKTSAGKFVAGDFDLLKTGPLGGYQLRKLDLSGAAHNAFAGAKITITSAHSAAGGDGFVNVGAFLATGHDLGAVSIDGDLGQLDAGDGDPLKSAVASLTVHSLGRYGTSTQAGASVSLESDVKGKLGALTIGSDLVGAFVNVDGSANDSDDAIGAISVGGSLRGGTVFAAGNLGAVKVGGSVIGGSGPHSGSIEAGGSIASVTLGDSLLGGVGNVSGSLIAGLTLGATVIGGDVNGGKIYVKGNNLPGTAALAVAIKSLSVAGSVLRADILAGFDRNGAPQHPDVQIGAVSVTRDWMASDLVAGLQPVDTYFGNGDAVIPGGNATVSRIASILIKGQVLGTPAAVNGGDSFGFVAQEIGSFTIGATKFPLTAGASNDLAGVAVGATSDVRIREA